MGIFLIFLFLLVIGYMYIANNMDQDQTAPHDQGS